MEILLHKTGAGKLFVKGQRANILVFAGHMVSVTLLNSDTVAEN